MDKSDGKLVWKGTVNKLWKFHPTGQNFIKTTESQRKSYFAFRIVAS